MNNRGSKKGRSSEFTLTFYHQKQLKNQTKIIRFSRTKALIFSKKCHILAKIPVLGNLTHMCTMCCVSVVQQRKMCPKLIMKRVAPAAFSTQPFKTCQTRQAMLLLRKIIWNLEFKRRRKRGANGFLHSPQSFSPLQCTNWDSEIIWDSLGWNKTVWLSDICPFCNVWYNYTANKFWLDHKYVAFDIVFLLFDLKIQT